MKDDSLSDTQKNNYCHKCDKEHDFMTDCVVMTKTNIVGKQDNVYAKEVWNEAIEAAITCVNEWPQDLYKLRELKK